MKHIKLHAPSALIAIRDFINDSLTQVVDDIKLLCF